MSAFPKKFLPLMGIVALAPFVGPLGLAWAQDPLVLSNDPRVSTSTRPTSLYWDVKQVELSGKDSARLCYTAKSMPDGSRLQVRAGQFLLDQIDVQSTKLALPKSSTVPVTLSFDRSLPPIQSTGKIEGEDRLIIGLQNGKIAYDTFSQASILRLSVADGPAMRGVTFDLAGLKTALAETQDCLSAPPTPPVSNSIKSAPPPPVPLRTPDAIVENFEGTLPDVTTGAAIPPLEWPDLDGEMFHMDDAALASDKPITSTTQAVPSISSPAAESSEFEGVKPIATEPPVQSTQMAVTANPAPPPPLRSKQKMVVSGPAVTKSVSPKAQPIETKSRRPVPTEPLYTYRARKGESLRDVLRRWSDRANIDLVWTMQSDIILDQDYSYVGLFNPAVLGLLNQYPQSGIKTTLAPHGTPPLERQPFIEEAQAPNAPTVAVQGADLNDFTPNPPPAVDRSRPPLMPYTSVIEGTAEPVSDVHAPPPAPKSALPLKAGVQATNMVTARPAEPSAPIQVGPVRRWRALTGASMRQVIQAWSEDAGIPVLWMSGDDFAIQTSVNQTTDFAGAVNTVLGQYANASARPQGQIYRDPHTGQTTLVVRIIK